MEDSIKTRNYLLEMSATLTHSQVRVNITHLPNFIFVFRRDYYIKRNGKSCYVDRNEVKIIPDLSRIHKSQYHNVFSTSENDWHPLVSNGTYYRIDKEYKKELIEQYT